VILRLLFARAQWDTVIALCNLGKPDWTNGLAIARFSSRIQS
jgi:hypothetical protein